MVLSLAIWEIKSVISAIRVRFTTEFFFEHGFIGLTRMLRSWRYCLPDSSHICHGNPETSSRVTLALLGIGFQPNLAGMVHGNHQ